MESFSPYAALEANATRDPDADAIIIVDVTVSHGEFLEKVTAYAGWLVQQGLVPTEVAGIAVRDEIGHIACATALLCLGVPQISLGAHELDATKRGLMRKVGVTQIVAERTEPWMESARTIPVPSSADLKAASVLAGEWCRARPLDTVVIYQNTSGSTNIPKTFGMDLRRIRRITEMYAADAKERRSLRAGSIEFDAHRLNRICMLIAGNTCVFVQQLTAGALVAICERAHVSIIHMGAYRLTSLLQSGSADRRLPAATAIQSGGSRVPGHLRMKVKARFTDNLWVQYATSEAGLISIASPDQHDRFPEGVGFPAPEVTLEIVNSVGEPVPSGEIGHIRLRKRTLPDGYVAERGATANFRDGWFYPGDLVSQGKGEPLVFHGRSDDVMILNGINVFPSAIEDTLESHADVREAIAYSLKSRIHGEIPVAAVVLDPQARERDADHLLEFCRQSLGIRGPRQIVVVDHIPRNAAGKPLRRELSRN